MQRRTKASDGTSTNLPLPSNSIHEDEGNDKNKRRKCWTNKRTSLFLVIAVFLAVICLSWLLFGRNELTETAIRAEHKMEDWLHDSHDKKEVPEASKGQQRQQQQQINQKQKNPSRDKSDTENRRISSDAATIRMEAQSSRWVDGEKALKKKLQVLYDRQQKGNDLGVPVLTRYLGEDIPAWITPEIMDEVEWKKKVEDKYEEMRQEEEIWKEEMSKIIARRERDIGITTS